MSVRQRQMPLQDTLVPLLLSPIGAIVVFYVFHFFNGSRSLLAPSGLIVVYVYGLAFALTFVMPLFLAVPRLRCVSWWAASCWGASVGLAITALGRRPFGWHMFALSNAGLFVSCGVAAALVYWLVARHSRGRRQMGYTAAGF